MTKEQLKTKLQTMTENQFTELYQEVAEAFPTTHDWYPGIIVPNFDELTIFTNGLGWNTKCEKELDQTLEKYPDIIFTRI